MMVIGFIGALGHGVAFPCLILVFGDMVDSFADSGKYNNILNDIAAFLTNVGITKPEARENPSLLS